MGVGTGGMGSGTGGMAATAKPITCGTNTCQPPAGLGGLLGGLRRRCARWPATDAGCVLHARQLVRHGRHGERGVREEGDAGHALPGDHGRHGHGCRLLHGLGSMRHRRRVVRPRLRRERHGNRDARPAQHVHHGPARAACDAAPRAMPAPSKTRVTDRHASRRVVAPRRRFARASMHEGRGRFALHAAFFCRAWSTATA